MHQAERKRTSSGQESRADMASMAVARVPAACRSAVLFDLNMGRQHALMTGALMLADCCLEQSIMLFFSSRAALLLTCGRGGDQMRRSFMLTQSS